MDLNKMMQGIGVCYYPEHWDKAFWPDDLRRMKENGVDFIRIAEFAWSIIEPREGDFQYGFFDEFLNLVETTDIKVIMGTPSAAPPAWLTRKYPEVLNHRIDGVSYVHGARKHCNYNSPVYQKLSCRIAENMAKHYGQRECIVGWQIDNELNCGTDLFFSESDREAFRIYLRKEYETLDRLNQAWGTVFWNQTYGDWEEIDLPGVVVKDCHNPHQYLDYIRFISESAIRFCALQAAVVRKHIKAGDFITTNGMFANLDNHRLTENCLDFFTYDSYPDFAFQLGRSDPADDLKDRNWSRKLSEVRSISSSFGIMEQQAGYCGSVHSAEAPAPAPGQMMLWAMQSVAHGADFLSFFRWRTSGMGTEIYWQGILDQTNRNNRRLRELKKISGRFRKICEALNLKYKASFGILEDYSNIWDMSLDVWHKRLESGSQKEIFTAAQEAHSPCDYIYINDGTAQGELASYSVLLYPHPAIMTEKCALLLQKYVENGGILVAGCCFGYKDRNGKCPIRQRPGFLSEWAGISVSDYSCRGSGNEDCFKWDNEEYRAGNFSEEIEVTDNEVKVIAYFSEGERSGYPAITEKAYGKGKIIYVAGGFERKFCSRLFACLGIYEPWSEMISLPAECEIAVRANKEFIYFFVLNYSSTKELISLRREAEDLDNGNLLQGELVLEPFETRVFKVHVCKNEKKNKN